MAAGTAKITLNTYSFPDGYVTGSGGNVEPISANGTTTGKIVVYYDQLDFTPSSADSYKSTSGDVFKVYVGGVRIYRRDDQDYASGYDFMEPGDNADGTKLAGLTEITATPPASNTPVSWNSTTNEVWTIDTTNSKILIDIEAIKATDLYGANGKALTFSTSSTVIELRRAVQELRSPSVDFSNASILTEQDLDNSAKNVFHVAQQASADVASAMKFSETNDAFEAYEPGTTTVKKIIGVATGTATNDAVNFGQFTSHDSTIIGYRDTTLGYKEDTEDYKLEAQDWATKENGVVNTYTDNVANSDGTEYSAKEYAVGTTVATGSSKDWASQDTTAVASGLFSAKEYASGSSATGGTAKEWAQKSDGAVDTEFSAKAYASVTGSNAPTDGSAKEWATTTGAQIDSDYSAKEYAIGTTATSAKSYATTTGSAVTGSDYSAKEWALGDLTATGGSAKAWAVDTSSPDGTTTKSAKTWAGEAATSAASADSVSTSNAIVMGIALG